MAERNRILPFWLTPSAWTLRGDDRREAQARHLYDGQTLERELIEIRHTDPRARAIALLALRRRHFEITAWEHDSALAEIQGVTPGSREDLDLQWRHGRINQHARAVALAKLDHPDETSLAHKLALLDADHQDGRIDATAYAKAKATLNEEPWIDIVDHGFDLSEGVNGVHFEFDWNDLWIDLLRASGYAGDTEQDVVEQWFAEVCRQQLGPDRLVVDPEMAMLIPLDRYRKDHPGPLRG